ncbi:MAG TPA: HAD-IA family hydrolase [Oculatellaceae cyanobacterium]
MKLIIFDFDGTIADTFEPLIKIIQRLSQEFGYKSVSPEDIDLFRNLTTREIIYQAGVSIWKLPFILRRIKKELNKDIKVVRPIQGMKEALLDLKDQGNQLGIITSNSQDNVQLFLENNHLDTIFSFICSGTTIFGKNKVINSVLIQKNINLSDVIYVGDETRDIEAAKKSNIQVIAVSWGFNSQEILANQNPDYLIDHPQQLTEVVNSLKQLIS